MAKQKLNMEKDVFNLTKKQKELEIKKAAYELDPEQLDIAKNKLKAETNAANALFNLRTTQVEIEQSKNTKELEQHKAGMSMMEKYLKGELNLPEGQTLRIGDFSIGNKSASQSNMTIEELYNAGAFGGGKSQNKRGQSASNKAATVDDFLSQF